MNFTAEHRIALISRSLLLCQVAVETSAALSEVGVPTIVLKGPATAHLLYEDPRLRSYADIDLLVAPWDYERAAQALQGLGYRDPWSGSSRLERSDHSKEFVGGEAEIDLHRCLPGVGAPPAVAWPALSAGAVALELQSGSVLALAPPAQVLHLALNAAHGGYGGRTVDELTMAMQRLPLQVWEEAASLGKRLACVGPMMAGLELAPDGLAFARTIGLEGPIPTGASVRARAASSPVVRLQDLTDAEGISSKLSLVARELVPTPAFLRLTSPLAARGRLGLVAAYIVRPIKVGRKLRPAVSDWLRLRRVARRPR